MPIENNFDNGKASTFVGIKVFPSIMVRVFIVPLFLLKYKRKDLD